MHRLQTVSYVGKRTRHDYAHRVIEIRLAHLIGYGNRADVGRADPAVVVLRRICHNIRSALILLVPVYAIPRQDASLSGACGAMEARHPLKTHEFCPILTIVLAQNVSAGFICSPNFLSRVSLT